MNDEPKQEVVTKEEIPESKPQLTQPKQEVVTKEEIPESKPQLDSAALERLGKLLTILDGKDPEAQQTLNKFISFESNIERSNLPTRRDVHFVSYLDMVGTSFFPNHPHNPFTVLADRLAVALMAKGGDKSKQFVDLMRNVPNIVDLQTSTRDGQKRGFVDRLFNRSVE